MTKLLTPIILALALIFTCVPAAAGYTPTNTQPSVYKMQAYVDGAETWSGTGTKVAEGFVLTAGHVCAGATTIRAFDEFGRSYPTTILKFSTQAERDLGIAPDICLLAAENIPGKPIPLLIGGVQRYTPVFMVGAPMGIYHDGVAPAVRGMYIGGNMCTIEGVQGYSGALVMTSEGAIGVVYSGYLGHSLFYFESTERIIDYLTAD